MPAHPDALTAARAALTGLQDLASQSYAKDVSPRVERELRVAMPLLAEVARTAALVSIAESLHALAAGPAAAGEPR